MLQPPISSPTIRLMTILILGMTNFIISSGFAQSTTPLRLDELIAETLQNNPKLQASRYAFQAARTQVKQAAAWDAPQIGIEFFQTPIQSFPNPVKNGMETDYFIQQMFPFPGKIRSMKKAAASNADMSEQNYHALVKQVVRELKTAYYDLYLVQRKININAENQSLMQRFVGIALKQYEVGRGGQPDILRAQTELSTLVTDGINLQQEKQLVEAMINTLLNRPVDAPLGDAPDIAISIPTWSFEQIAPLALQARPELKAMAFNIDMNKAEVSLARREYWPDFMMRLMYKDMSDTNNDFWAVMGAVSVPIAFWSSGRYTGKVQENLLKVRKAESEYAEMKNMILFEVQQALVKVANSKNIVLLSQNTVIPQAEQTLQSTIAAYQTGKAEFLMPLEASRMLLMARLDYYMAVMNLMASQAALEQAVGLEIQQIQAKLP